MKIAPETVEGLLNNPYFGKTMFLLYRACMLWGFDEVSEQDIDI